MLACHCKDVEVTSSRLTRREHTRQDVSFSTTIPSHTHLEGNDNKQITVHNYVHQSTKPSISRQFHNNKEANTSQILNNPSYQILDYNVKNYFMDRRTSSRADHNPKRLILRNYTSAELQTDTAKSKDALLKYRASLPQHNQQNDNVFSLHKQPKNVINCSLNVGDDDTQHKSISSDTDVYFIRNTSTTAQQKTVHTSVQEDTRRHLKQQDHLEDFSVTERDNRSSRLNTEKYDKKVTLNTGMPQDNIQYTPLDKDPVEVSLAGTYKQLSKKESDTTYNSIAFSTYNGKDLERFSANHSSKMPTISLNDIQNLRFSNKHAKQVETNPDGHSDKQIFSDQIHRTSSCKHASDESEISNKFYSIFKKTKDKSLNNQLQQVFTSTTKNIPAMSSKEMHIHSNIAYEQNVKNSITNEDLFENDVYINTNKISNLHAATDKAQSLKRILTNSISGKTRYRRSLLLHAIQFPKNSDSSSRNLPKDNLYLDQGSHRESNNLALKNTWPHQVIQNMLKHPVMQQPTAEESEADSGMDFLQKQFQRAERLSKAFEWFFRFLKVVGQADSYLRDRIRSVVRMVAHLYDSDNARENYRSCN